MRRRVLAVVAAGVLGNLIGSWVAYGIGYYGRVEVLERHGKWLHITPKHLAWADSWFQSSASEDGMLVCRAA